MAERRVEEQLEREQIANKRKHWVRAVTACNSRCLFCLDADTPPASLPSSPLATRGAAGPVGGSVPEEFALPASGPPPANGVVVHGLG